MFDVSKICGSLADVNYPQPLSWLVAANDMKWRIELFRVANRIYTVMPVEVRLESGYRYVFDARVYNYLLSNWFDFENEKFTDKFMKLIGVPSIEIFHYKHDTMSECSSPANKFIDCIWIQRVLTFAMCLQDQIKYAREVESSLDDF